MSIPRNTRLAGGSLVSGVLLALFSNLAAADYGYNFQPPVTSIAREMLNLQHYFLCLRRDLRCCFWFHVLFDLCAS